MPIANTDDTRTLVPKFNVRVSGIDLPPQATADLVSVSVYEDTKAPTMFTIQMINWDMSQRNVTWSDDDLFAEGNEVEIQMGYSDNLETLFVGEVTGLEPEFNAGEVPRLTVRGYDRGHRLLRGCKIRSFNQIKDSDIARQIASDHGLTAEIEDTQVVIEYVLQNNQTDLNFLQNRATRIGYEVVVKGRILKFRSCQIADNERLTLARDQDLIEFYPRLTTLTQVGGVTVRSWNSKEKKEIVGQASAGDEATTMDGSTSGPDRADRAFSLTSNVRIVDNPVFSREEADQMARGRFNEMALAYIVGEGMCIGRPDLRVGTIVRIEGLGHRFSGLYYVITTAHTYEPGRGYRTGFTVRRNAT